MSKHTPGPWWVTRGREVRAHKPFGSPVVLDTVGICEVYSGGAGIEGADASARLIAAAPDLFDFASEFLADYESDEGMFSMKHYAKKARAAIAKATGEKS